MCVYVLKKKNLAVGVFITLKNQNKQNHTQKNAQTQFLVEIIKSKELNQKSMCMRMSIDTVTFILLLKGNLEAVSL